MDIAHRLALSSARKRPEGAGFTVSLLGLTDNPTYGICAERGTQITAVATGADVPEELSYQWHVVGQGSIAGAYAASFIPDAPLADESVIYCVISTPSMGQQLSGSVVYRQAPPVPGMVLFDEIFDLDTGVQLVMAATGFVGGELRYAVSGAGATIDADTGEVSLPTDLPREGEIVRVTASNSGGALSTTFMVTVEEMALEGALPFGGLTPAGMGGVPVAASTITAGDPGGHWEITGGYLVPTATGASALAGVYPLVFDTGATLDILIEDDRASARIDELETVFAALPLTARGLMVQNGDGRALGRLRLVPKIFAQEMVLEPTNWVEDTDPRRGLRPVALGGLTIGGDLAAGDINNRMENLTVQGFLCNAVQGPGETETGNGIIRVERPSRHVTIRQNEIWSRACREIQLADDFRDGSATHGMLRGIATNIASNSAANEHIRVEENYIHDVSRGVLMTATNSFGGQNSRLCDNIIENCYTNFYTIGYLDGLDIFDNKCMHITAQLQDTLGSFPADSPHASTGLSGDAGGSRSTQNVTAMGNFQHIGWIRKLIQEDLGLPVGDTAATGAKFNDPQAFDSYYNIIFAFNTIISHGLSLSLNGASADSHNLMFNNTLAMEPYVTSSPPVIAFGGVTNMRMFNNIAPQYRIGGEDGGSQVGGVETLDTLEGYGNLRINNATGGNGLGSDEYFVGDPVKGFDLLTLDEAIAAYVPKAGTRAMTAAQKKGSLGTGLYLGNGAHTVTYDKPEPSGGTSHAYEATVWDGQYVQRSTGTGLSGSSAANGLTIAMQGTTSAVLDGIGRCIFSMTGQTVKLQHLGSGRLQTRVETSDNAVLFQGQVGLGSNQTFNHDDGKVSLLMSLNLESGEAHFLVNGVLANWMDISSIGLGSTNLSAREPRVFADEGSTAEDFWQGELDLFYLDDAIYDFEVTSEIDRFLATDGYFKDFGTNGAAPSGHAPLLYVAGDAASIAGMVNKGMGGICILSGGAVVDVS